MNDITFSYDGLGETKSNFTAIGNDDDIRYFGGHFDGNGHTISGIRIYKGGEDREDNYQGLFGYLARGAEVKNVILTDANIVGNTYVGGIVGYNDNGTVTNCHATSSVNHPCRCRLSCLSWRHRGRQLWRESRCKQLLQLRYSHHRGRLNQLFWIRWHRWYYYTNDGNTATVKNCIVAGATIPAYESLYGPTYGAVVGINEGTLQNNYYTACNVGGVENATGVGCSQYEGSDLVQRDVDGAKPALLDKVDNTDAIAAIDALSKNITYSVCINGRTLYKDGTWNTLCLPFDLRDFTGTLLEDAEVRTLDISSFGNTGFDETTGTLTLDFIKIDEVFAGTPFIVRWGTPEEPGGENIVNPVFHAVKVENATK